MMVDKVSAPITKTKWSTLDWATIELRVKSLQFRIAKATREVITKRKRCNGSSLILIKPSCWQ